MDIWSLWMLSLLGSDSVWADNMKIHSLDGNCPSTEVIYTCI